MAEEKKENNPGKDFVTATRNAVPAFERDERWFELFRGGMLRGEWEAYKSGVKAPSM